MQIRYRRAKPGEISHARHLLEPDRPLFSQKVWERLPEVLEDLRSRERILLCIAEDTDAGKILFVGGSGFLQPGFLDSAVAGGQGILDAALTTELDNQPAFLNHKQIAEGNRNEDLRLLSFLGVPNWADFNRPDAGGTLEGLAGDPILTGVMEAWMFFHKGFRIREIWLDSAVPLMVHVYEIFASRICQERWLRCGRRARLLRFSREQAVENWPRSYLASAMFSPPPRFGFTRAEQKLLELALLDCSDREAVVGLGLSAEAIKKRWRSI